MWVLWNWNWQRLQCGTEYKRCWKRNVEILGNKKTGQGLSEELGKYIWLTEADTSQEAPASESGSSSLGNIGFAEYTVKDGKVYWDDELVVKYVNGVVSQYNKFLPDVESFKILKDGSRDKGTIYYKVLQEALERELEID